MTLGLVIVSFQCRALLMTCLESVARWAPGCLPETVIVDNASRDGTVEAVRAAYPEVRVIANSSNVGFAEAANQGMAALPGRQVICLLNPDAELLDEGLAAVAEYLEAHADVGVAGGRILNRDGSVQASARAFPGHRNAFFNRHSLATRLFPRNRLSSAYLLTDWDHSAVREVDWVSGAFMFVHRRALEACGGFDPAFFFSIEDVDFCRRVRDAGLQVVYSPAASIRHRIGGSSSKNVYRAMRAHHQGMWRYYRKHLRGNILVDGATFAGIWARFGIHAVSYALRTAKNRLLGRPNP